MKSHISNYDFECHALTNDTPEDAENIHLYTPCNTAYISRDDTIAIARHFKLDNKDLKIDEQ